MTASVPGEPDPGHLVIELPETLTALVAEAEGVVEQRADVLHLRFSDVVLLVRATEGRFVVERVNRGVVEGPDLATTSRAALERFLVLSCGGSWRSKNRLRPLRVPASADGAVTAPLRPDGPRWTVDWVDADGVQQASCWSRLDAREVAWTVPAALDAVVESFRALDEATCSTWCDRGQVGDLTPRGGPNWPPNDGAVSAPVALSRGVRPTTVVQRVTTVCISPTGISAV